MIINRLIEIQRDEKQVKILFNNGPLNATYHFSFDCGDKYYAELLRNHFTNELEATIASVRKEEYEKGYNHGRGKQAKKGWFSGWLRKGDA